MVYRQTDTDSSDTARWYDGEHYSPMAHSEGGGKEAGSCCALGKPVAHSGTASASQGLASPHGNDAPTSSVRPSYAPFSMPRTWASATSLTSTMAFGVAYKETHLFFEFSLYLSRACLGRMIVFLHKWRKNAVFRRRRSLTTR